MHKRKDGYVEEKKKLQHRLVWETINGPIPVDYHVHHINGKKDDNRIENLALVHKSVHGAMHSGHQLKHHSEKTRKRISFLRRTGVIPGRKKTFCSVKNCESPSHGWGFCNKHYIRLKKFGDPLGSKNGDVLT